MYLTMFPLILGGIANMVFTKTKFYKKHASPMDKGKVWKDGKRIFGENKTWIGFVSMIIFCIFFQIICGSLCNILQWNHANDLYVSNDNTIWFNALFGALIGFTYMLFELPNSFIKRRFDIDAGKSGRGIKGIIFFIIDQIDSLVGVMFILYLFTDISIWKYFGYILVGAFTHIAVNGFLCLMKVRKRL